MRHWTFENTGLQLCMTDSEITFELIGTSALCQSGIGSCTASVVSWCALELTKFKWAMWLFGGRGRCNSAMSGRGGSCRELLACPVPRSG
eukprot:3277958-Amphidinium_carterae.1